MPQPKITRSEAEAVVTALFGPDRPARRDSGPRSVGQTMADALEAAKARHPASQPTR